MTTSRRIFAPIHPKLVLLFGSRARGTEDEMSDVDLIVVYDTDKRFLDRLEELYRLWDRPGGVDSLAYTPVEFEEMKERSGLVADAVGHGRVIAQQAAEKALKAVGMAGRIVAATAGIVTS